MAQTAPDVHIPQGEIISVKLINPVNFGPSQIRRFMKPPVEGLETFPSVPSLCFLLEHPSGRKLVWDLGIRKDYENYAPKIANYIPTTGYSIDAPKHVSEILEDGGVPLDQIEAVIWRYVCARFNGNYILAGGAKQRTVTGTGITSATRPLSLPRQI